MANTNSRNTSGKSTGSKSTNSRKNKMPTHSEVIKERDQEKRELQRLKDAANKKAVSDEVVIILTILISVLLYLSLFGICGIVGKAIKVSLYWLVGRIVAFAFPALLVGIVIYNRIHPDDPLATSKSTIFIIFVELTAAVIHLCSGCATEHFTATFRDLQNGIGGGFFGALIAESMYKLIGTIASVIVLAVAMLICVMLVFRLTPIAAVKNRKKEKKPDQYEFYDNYSDYEEEQKKKRMAKEETTQEDSFRQMTLAEHQEYIRRAAFQDSQNRRQMQTVTLNDKNGKPVSGGPAEKPRKKNVIQRLMDRSNEPVNENKTTISDVPASTRTNTNGRPRLTEVPVKTGVPVFSSELEKKFGSYDNTQTTSSSITKDRSYEDDEDYYYDARRKQEEQSLPRSTSSLKMPDVPTPRTSSNTSVRIDASETSVNGASPLPTAEDIQNAGVTRAKASNASNKAENSDASEALQIDSSEKPQKPYVFPSLNLLEKPKHTAGSNAKMNPAIRETAEKLQSTLTSFGVNVTVTDIAVGPTVTRYELQPEVGVKVSRITALADDIKLNLAAADIRIEAPIPGKAAVGIEVPNQEKSAVLLRSLLESPDFKDSNGKLCFTVGRDISGQIVISDISKMPHMLIAGATGSGKSVFTNSIIMSLLYKYEPKDVRLILIDPKVVEFSIYNGIPHLLIPVVTDPKKANSALNWAVMEMTDRYKKFAELGVKDLSGYNKKVEASAEPMMDPAGIPYKHLPLIVIVIDELADLMTVASKEVEESICRLAQLARAAGIHLVIATQRPSVDVITGLIKANIPSRVALSVSSQIDSRTILDGAGAEKLLGHGDMLFYPAGIPKPVRIQGAYVSETEISNVVDFLKSKNESNGYNPDIAEHIENGVASVSAQMNGSGGTDDGRDEFFEDAGRFIIQKDKASIGMLQRVYKIGFNRAARIMDQLCEAGVVGPEEGTKPRKILMTESEFESLVNM